MQTTQTSHGTALPWTAFFLGALGSLAANVWHAAGAAQAAGITRQADLVAALWFSALVPVALLLVTEIMIRSARTRDGLAAVMWIGAGAVAVGAAVMSFSHMYSVMVDFGQPPYIAALMPLAVDGMMLVASIALARAAIARNAASAADDSGAERAAPEPVRHDDSVPETDDPAPGTVPEPAAPADESAALSADVPDEHAAPMPETEPERAAVPDSVPVPVPPRLSLVPPMPDGGETVPEDVPPAPEGGTRGDAAADREAAREMIVRAETDGRQLTGRDVGAAFGRSERWGRARLAERGRERQSDVADR